MDAVVNRIWLSVNRQFFFSVSSVRRSTIQYWPGLHNIISLAFSRWVGNKLNLFCFFCCSGSAFKSSANESRQKENKKKNSSISIVHRVPRCSSHPSVGGALLLRLSSYSTPHSSMPTKVGLWILIKMSHVPVLCLFLSLSLLHSPASFHSRRDVKK